MSPLAQEVTAETVATVKDKSQQAARVVNQTWQQEASTEDLTERLIKFLRAIAQTTKAALFPQVQKQASKLDDILTQRYGSRYENMREKANVARTWYAASEPTTTETKPDASSEQAVVIEVNSQVIS
ncbi:MAG: hypothetical protein HC800_22405 [Phormidesmis sp. RL_2_1]|nr:hypothetical protein [Phormidesmis sp. RL_2_1]